jgi:hypothetical protein
MAQDKVQWQAFVMKVMKICGFLDQLISWPSIHSDRKQALGRQTHGWEDNIKMDICKISCKEVKQLKIATDYIKWCSLYSLIVELYLQVVINEVQPTH